MLKSLFLVAAFLTPPALSATDANDTSLSAAGDATVGQRVFNRCKACHLLTESDRKRLGPHLENLFGRQAGAVADYKYSRALKEADFVWTEKMLDDWLTKPRAFLPGNKMQFAGLRREQDRKDLIAYLRKATVKAE